MRDSSSGGHGFDLRHLISYQIQFMFNGKLPVFVMISRVFIIILGQVRNQDNLNIWIGLTNATKTKTEISSNDLSKGGKGGGGRIMGQSTTI